MLSPGSAVHVRGNGVPYSYHGIDQLQTPDASPTRIRERANTTHSEELISAALGAAAIDIGADANEGLRSLAWGGVPPHLRGQVWRLLSDCVPPVAARQDREHFRKTNEYSDFVRRYFDTSSGIVAEKQILHQISIDLPRHKMALYHIPELKGALERVLYIWALRHPAVGYVQGMDDIITIFFILFLGEQMYRCRIRGGDAWAIAASPHDASDALKAALWTAGGPLSEEVLRGVEADTYWCGGKVLSWMQDNLVHGLAGVHGMVLRLQALLDVVDPALSLALSEQCVDLQFTFQWMHCVLTRELSTPLALRLWDTYLSIGPTFCDFHVYVCCALLSSMSPHIIRLARDGATDEILALVKRPCPKDAAVTFVDEHIAAAYMLHLQHPPHTVWQGTSKASL